MQECATAKRNEQAITRKELLDRLDFTERQLEMMTAEMKDKICALVEDVEYKVAKGLSEEIRRLAVLVDEFNDPFHPDPLVVNVYKSKLAHHLESGVGSNLKARLSADLQLNMETQQRDMMDRMTALLPLEKQTVMCSWCMENIFMLRNIMLQSPKCRLVKTLNNLQPKLPRSGDTSPSPTTRAAYYGVSQPLTGACLEHVAPRVLFCLVATDRLWLLCDLGTAICTFLPPVVYF